MTDDVKKAHIAIVQPWIVAEKKWDALYWVLPVENGKETHDILEGTHIVTLDENGNPQLHEPIPGFPPAYIKEEHKDKLIEVIQSMELYELDMDGFATLLAEAFGVPREDPLQAEKLLRMLYPVELPESVDAAMELIKANPEYIPTPDLSKFKP